MKRVLILASLILFLGVSLAHAYTSPGKPQGFVNDFAKILSIGGAASLNQTLSDFSSQTTIQIAVVTIPALGDETIETYAVQLFEEWGVGQKGKDNGVLLLVAPTERKVRIEVGYGLEGVLTDAQSNGIIQKIILPEFRNGNMEAGIVNGTNAIVSVVKSEADYSGGQESSSKGINWEILIYIGLFLVFSIIRGLSKTKSWWAGGVIGAIAGIIIGFIYGFVFVGIVSIVILTLIGLILDFIVSKHPPKDGGGGFWPIFFGGGRGGSSGGGFGGFGGGGSGGGGSSGSW